MAQHIISQFQEIILSGVFHCFVRFFKNNIMFSFFYFEFFFVSNYIYIIDQKMSSHPENGEMSHHKTFEFQTSIDFFH